MRGTGVGERVLKLISDKHTYKEEILCVWFFVCGLCVYVVCVCLWVWCVCGVRVCGVRVCGVCGMFGCVVRVLSVGLMCVRVCECLCGVCVVCVYLCFLGCVFVVVVRVCVVCVWCL